jgi:hypothetical protein
MRHCPRNGSKWCKASCACRATSALLDYGERDSLTELLNRKTFDGAFLKATLDQQNTASGTPELPPGKAERRDGRATGSF